MAVHTFGCQNLPPERPLRRARRFGGRGGWKARNPGLTIQLSQSRLSITQRFPSTSVGRGKKKKRRLLDLAKPKTNLQALKDK